MERKRKEINLARLCALISTATQETEILVLGFQVSLAFAEKRADRPP